MREYRVDGPPALARLQTRAASRFKFREWIEAVALE
jgi:hypothetical protein